MSLCVLGAGLLSVRVLFVLLYSFSSEDTLALLFSLRHYLEHVQGLF